MRSKQLSSGSVYRAQVFAGFFNHGTSTYNTDGISAERVRPHDVCPWYDAKHYDTIYQPLRSGTIWHKVNF